MINSYCGHCDKLSKYKCTICKQPYCSVVCYKKHKESPCSAAPEPEPPEVQPKVEYEFPTEDTVAPEKLEQLANSKELRNCLANPHVRRILETLDATPHPDRLMEKYMQEPIFTEFVDECLKIVQPTTDDN